MESSLELDVALAVVAVGTVGTACSLVVFGSLLVSGIPWALFAPSDRMASFLLRSTFAVETSAGPFVVDPWVGS